MYFCPFCGTLLLLTPSVEGNRLRCSTCAYAVPIHETTVGSRTGGPPVLTVTHSFRKGNRPFAEAEPERGDRSGSPSSQKPGGDRSGVEEEEAVEESGGAEGGQLITVPCQNDKDGCTSQKAYYIQIQMRSADEPPSTFFRCVKCGFQWRQD